MSEEISTADEARGLIQVTSSGKSTVTTTPARLGFYADGRKGLGLGSTTLFVVGGMAGSGILAIPVGVVMTGWIGVVMIALSGLVSAYTGVLLGDCWQTLLAQWPDQYARVHVRHPYSAIGQRAVGRWGQLLSSVSIDSGLFCVATVYLLLVSENLSSLFPGRLDYRVWIVIVAAAVLPFCWLESPKDATLVAVLASAFTAAGTLIVFTLLVEAGPQKHIFRPRVTFDSFCLGVSIIVFSFGGHASFPTWQHDMKNPSRFWLAILASYIIILFYYIPVATVGSEFFQNQMKSNVLLSFDNGRLVTVVKWMFTLHIFFAYVIVANPISQDLERQLKVPQRFCLQRIVVRTLQVTATLAVAEAVPCFDKILQLIGSSATMLLSYILPSIFYIQLSKQIGRQLPLHTIVLNYEIIAVGFLAMIACTFSAVKDLIGGCQYYHSK